MTTGSRSPTCDVVVVGLGPAGAAAAAAAAGAGLRVIGLDRRKAPGVPVQCAEFVPLSLAADVPGLADFVVQPIETMATFLEQDGPRHDALPGHIVDRTRFDAHLVAIARDAGARCRFGVAVTALDRDGLRLADGSSLTPRLIVGADGPRSLVGRAIGRVNRVFSHARQITVPLLRPHRATDVFLAAAYPGGYGWLFPRGPVARLGIGIDASARLRLPGLLDRLHARLSDEGRVGAAVLETTGGPIPAGGLVGPTGRLGATPVLLAGDAGGLANPVTGAGIAAAVVSGRAAGTAAAEILGGCTGGLEAYAEEIADLFGPALDRARRRREAVMRAHRDGRLGPADLERAWIAFESYWRDDGGREAAA